MNIFPELEWFFGAIFIYFSAFVLIDHEFKSNENYTLLAIEKKSYFQKNILKSFALVLISIFGSVIFFDGFINNKWNNQQIYRLGYFYSALDFLGLLKVHNLPKNSKIHHIITFILSLINSQIDYNIPSIWRGLIIYCLLSSYAFGVNYFLGVRLIFPLGNLRKIIKYNIISYASLLLINWSFQVYNTYIHFSHTMESYIYIALLLGVAFDDVKLVRFLNHHYKKAIEELFGPKRI